jgi:hypothetical protein
MILKAPPWGATICVRGTVFLENPACERVYEDRYVVWGRMAWGFAHEYKVHADTQRSAALDEYLASVATTSEFRTA